MASKSDKRYGAQKGPNLMGKRFGHLSVIGDGGKDKWGARLWLCQCDCKRTVKATTAELNNGRKKACAIWDHEILGKRFGRLIVLDYERSDDRGSAFYRCQCDCGRNCVVKGSQLTTGKTISCGCAEQQNRRENLKAYKLKDCVEGTRLHQLSSEPTKQNTSGVRGVFWNARNKRWVARIDFKGQRYYLGAYRDLEAAAHVRREAEQMLYDPLLEKHGLTPTDESEWRERIKQVVSDARRSAQ